MKKDSVGSTSDYAKMIQNHASSKSPNKSSDNRSKLKNMKNSYKLQQNTGLANYSSPKRHLYTIQENNSSKGSLNSD